MNLPDPVPGLVLRYAYLWKREADAGRDEGTKDRPCAIVLSATLDNGLQRVLVLPVTHSPPASDADAVEIPAATGTRLGLDDARSWIVVTEANDFIWPGPDLRPRPGAQGAAYGLLPPALFRTVRDRFIAVARRERRLTVKRSE